MRETSWSRARLVDNQSINPSINHAWMPLYCKIDWISQSTTAARADEEETSAGDLHFAPQMYKLYLYLWFARSCSKTDEYLRPGAVYVHCFSQVPLSEFGTEQGLECYRNSDSSKYRALNYSACLCTSKLQPNVLTNWNERLNSPADLPRESANALDHVRQHVLVVREWGGESLWMFFILGRGVAIC